MRTWTLTKSALLSAATLCLVTAPARAELPGAERRMGRAEGRTGASEQDSRARRSEQRPRSHESGARAFYKAHIQPHFGGHSLLDSLATGLRGARHAIGFGSASKGARDIRPGHLDANNDLAGRDASAMRAKGARVAATVSGMKNRLLARVRALAPRLMLPASAKDNPKTYQSVGISLSALAKKASEELHLPGVAARIGNWTILKTDLKDGLDKLAREMFALNSGGVRHGKILKNVVFTRQGFKLTGWGDNRGDATADPTKDLRDIGRLGQQLGLTAAP